MTQDQYRNKLYFQTLATHNLKLKFEKQYYKQYYENMKHGENVTEICKMYTENSETLLREIKEDLTNRE